MTPADRITTEMTALANPAEAAHLMRFFKTAPGQYGEGDKFLGIRVPITRRIAGSHLAEATIFDADRLTQSEWHEVRLAGFLILTEIYHRAAKQGNRKMCQDIVNFYIDILDRANNWDLVDLSAPKLLGAHILSNTDKTPTLYNLSKMEGQLWHQRVAIVATLTLIKSDIFEPTISIAESYLNHNHDLIQKAAGWMLREIGKRSAGLPLLISFLDRHAAQMPRIMLRYAIEKLPEPQRQHYMKARKLYCMR